MSTARRNAAALFLAGAMLAPPAHADLRPRPTFLDLSAGAPVIDLVAPAPSTSIAIVDRAAEQARSEAIPGLIAQAAAGTGVPADFLLRLLRQESGLNHLAVSPKGAQGIAQFMPATAAERGLADPFDPAQAIPKAAELLRDLRSRFGNWGLAAAAYNAGPGRIDAWLVGRSTLPQETVDYVARITGVDAVTWAAGHSLAGGVWLLQSRLSAPANASLTSLGTDTNLTLLPIRSRTDTPAASNVAGRTAEQAAGAPLSVAQLRAAAGGTGRSKRGHGDATSPCAALLNAASTCLDFTRY